MIAANRGADNKLLVFKIQQNGLLGQPQVYKANGIEPRAFHLMSQVNICM